MSFNGVPSHDEMNKRLRKKKLRGEFTEWGRQPVITRNRKEGFDEFLDAFIEQVASAEVPNPPPNLTLDKG